MNNQYKYIVATRCFTYNHIHYIEDTLNGFVSQKTSFPMVYIIVDDASNDGEKELLYEWANKHLYGDVNSIDWKCESYGTYVESRLKNNPNSTFVIMLLNENHFSRGKHFLKFDYMAKWLSSSKYLAVCEGDDYWKDPIKLQKQVDYLESHESVNICVHNAIRMYDDGKSELFNKKIKTGIYNLRKSLYMGWFTPTASFLYRNNIEVSQLWAKNGSNGDMALLYSNLMKGDLYYFDDVMSVYNFGTPSSMSSSTKKSLLYRKKRGMLKSINQLSKKYILFTLPLIFVTYIKQAIWWFLVFIRLK